MYIDLNIKPKRIKWIEKGRAESVNLGISLIWQQNHNAHSKNIIVKLSFMVFKNCSSKDAVEDKTQGTDGGINICKSLGRNLNPEYISNTQTL